MGKAKKNVSKQQIQADGDEESQEEMEVTAVKSSKVKGNTKPVKTASVESEDEESDEPQLKKDAKKSKAKKQGKAVQHEDSDENLSDTEIVANTKSNKGANDSDTKSKKKGKVDEENKKSKSGPKGKKGKREDSDEDDDVEVEPSAPVSAFALLAVESGNEEDEVSEEETSKKVKNKKGKKGKPEKIEPEKTEDSTGKKAKRKGKKKEEEEDIEKMLAELELEYSGKKVEKPIEETKTETEKEGKKKKGRKGKVQEEEVPEVEPEQFVEEPVAEEAEVVDKKKKKNKKKKSEERTIEETVEPQVEETIEQAEPVEPAEVVDTEQTEEKKKKKKKKKAKEEAPASEAVDEAEQEADDKKKKGKKKEEAGKKEKKGPSNKAIAAIREHLQKIKEEEERLRKEAEEAQRRAEEEERQRQEQLRIEREKREAKKQREKEKKERLKAEGKLLTAKQRAQLARHQKSLEALRAQGVDVPVAGEKRPRPGARIRPSKQREVQKETDEPGVEEKIEELKEDEEVKEVEATPEKEEEEVKESWDVDSSSEEEEEVEEKVSAAAPVAKVEAEPEEEETSSDESESSEEEETESEESDESDSEEEETTKNDAASRRQKAIDRIQKRREEAEKKRSLDVLRAPVVCVLGHVDTGKTKILDKLRRTHVQDAEAGGITQQIGATNVPIDAIREASKMVTSFQQMVMKIPGLLIIDTPGHESFSNLRSRGSSLCDIAILVVDIMHGLEPQTLESINLLKQKKTPFVVALNKIDRLYNWTSNARKDVRDLIKMQEKNTQQEFQDRTKSVILQFAEQSLNAALFYENPDPRSYVSMVPTSAATGDGMGNLMALIVELTQTALSKRLMYSDELHATVLEVKAIPGYGTTIDVILVNGTLHEGDTIVLAGTEGPIVTQIRSLLMPQPMKELRVKNTYTEHKMVQAAQGVKITAKDLEKAIAGLNLLVAHQPDEVDICKEEVAGELKSALGRIKLQERGVYVQASTLGSLEALLEFLKTSQIPYSNIRIGPVVKKDVMKASIMLEHDPQYAVILAFDVKIERDAQEMADSIGVRIFQADIIYHLFDRFMLYREELKQKKRDEFKHIAVFPCKLRILPQFIFNSRDPIVVGVMVESGVVKEGTPLCVPTKEFVEIGVVTTIEVNHKAIETARKGQEVCLKISPIPGQAPKMLGRHFETKDLLVSKISRESIDACKEYFRDDLQKADWQLMIELKKLFQIL